MPEPEPVREALKMEVPVAQADTVKDLVAAPEALEQAVRDTLTEEVLVADTLPVIGPAEAVTEPVTDTVSVLVELEVPEATRVRLVTAEAEAEECRDRLPLSVTVPELQAVPETMVEGLLLPVSTEEALAKPLRVPPALLAL